MRCLLINRKVYLRDGWTTVLLDREYQEQDSLPSKCQKPSLNCQVPESHSFGLWELLDFVKSQKQELGLIIDLTFTTRYYQVSDVPQSCSYVKIFVEGHRIPSDIAILSFKRAVRRFLKENENDDSLIGVHCTHGLNRTGYLVCRYLIDVDGLDPSAALELFNSCRGHRIKRLNYLNDLQSAAKRSNEGIDEPDENVVRGLAVHRQLLTAKTKGPGSGEDSLSLPPHLDEPNSVSLVKQEQADTQ